MKTKVSYKVSKKSLPTDNNLLLHYDKNKSFFKNN